MSQLMKTANNWSINVDDLPLSRQEQYLQQSLPSDAGLGQSNIFKIDDDLSVIETSCIPSKKLSIISKIEQAEPRLVVTLGLKGHSLFSGRKGKEIVFSEGCTTITAFNSSTGHRLYEANKEVLQLRFSVTQSWLSRYFGADKFAALFSKKNIQIITSQPISPSSLFTAQKMLSKTDSQTTQQILVHAQALTILAAELEQAGKDSLGKISYNKPTDQVIAVSARDILFHEYKNPPSVAELAIRSGTNPYKLKQLFHHFYSNTPYGLLLEIRMQKAYHLLKTSHCHVGIAADAVGYNHPSNFSAAFTKHYGITPKQLLKT